MKKILKKMGNSVGFNFTAEEQRLEGLRVGRAYDIEIAPIRNAPVLKNKRRKS